MKLIFQPYNLFLDDCRIPEDAHHYMLNKVYLAYDWVVVENYNEFVDCIKRNGIPRCVSFDHDLATNIEEWVNVLGYEGIYMVSNYGRIKRILRSKGTTGNNILSPIKNESGLYVTLYNLKKKNRKKIHRIVLESFFGIDIHRPQVNHKDGNRWNNFLENLEWNTQSENVLHSYRHLNRKYTSYGENHGNSLSVTQYTKNGIFINTYGSVNEASRQLKIPFTNIAKCSRNERKSAGGFVWKYENKPITIKSEVYHIDNHNYIENFYIPEIPEEKTGYHCAKWLIEYGIDNNISIPEEIYVHSMNPVGNINIKSLFETYKKIV